MYVCMYVGMHVCMHPSEFITPLRSMVLPKLNINGITMKKFVK